MRLLVGGESVVLRAEPLAPRGLRRKAPVDPAADRLRPLLDRMVDFERLRPQQREWDLGGIERLLRRDGAAPGPRPAVQVAGSKGKGTTAAFLEALGSAGGRRVGCYSLSLIHI